MARVLLLPVWFAPARYFVMSDDDKFLRKTPATIDVEAWKEMRRYIERHRRPLTTKPTKRRWTRDSLYMDRSPQKEDTKWTRAMS